MGCLSVDEMLAQLSPQEFDEFYVEHELGNQRDWQLVDYLVAALHNLAAAVGGGKSVDLTDFRPQLGREKEIKPDNQSIERYRKIAQALYGNGR